MCAFFAAALVTSVVESLLLTESWNAGMLAVLITLSVGIGDRS